METLNKYQEQLNGVAIEIGEANFACVQVILFELGYTWHSGASHVLYEDDPEEYLIPRGSGFGSSIYTLGLTIIQVEDVYKLLQQKRNEEKNMFDINTLKTGMRVLYGDGNIGIVFVGTGSEYSPDIIAIEDTNGVHTNIEVRDFGVCNTGCGSIDKVYDLPKAKRDILDKDQLGEVLWERGKAPKTVEFGGKEYTKEEIDKLQESLSDLSKQF